MLPRARNSCDITRRCGRSWPKRDSLMSPSPSGPDAISWAIAALRGLHPLRWCMSAVGLAISTVVLAGASAFWFADAPQLSQWFRDPGPTAVDFGNRMTERSFFVMVFRIGLLFIVLGGVWNLIGCWIARHELLARHR